MTHNENDDWIRGFGEQPITNDELSKIKNESANVPPEIIHKLVSEIQLLRWLLKEMVEISKHNNMESQKTEINKLAKFLLESR